MAAITAAHNVLHRDYENVPDPTATFELRRHGGPDLRKEGRHNSNLPKDYQDTLISKPKSTSRI